MKTEMEEKAVKIFHELATELDDGMEALSMVAIGHADELDDEAFGKLVKRLVVEYNKTYE